MAKNRKNQSGAVRFVPALKAIFLCMLIGGSAVGYVLQKNKLYELGRQITRRELLLEKLTRENTLRAAQLSSLQMPLRLAERAKEQKLGLVQPQTWQCIYLVEPSLTQTTRPTSLLLTGK